MLILKRKKTVFFQQKNKIITPYDMAWLFWPCGSATWQL